MDDTTPLKRPGKVQKRVTSKKENVSPNETPVTTATGEPSFSIVGIGASAGGLEAVTQLLNHVPANTGLAFVLVQHLDPNHESALPELIGRATIMPICKVVDGMRTEPNHVYVIPPNKRMTITSGVLRLYPRPSGLAPFRSIDFFFEALAQDRREHAIGVILSGTASDGTLGLEAIKSEGGITFAQDSSAKYDSMPRSAVAAGCVDFELSPEAIAKELAKIAAHPYIASRAPKRGRKANRPTAPDREHDYQVAPSNGRRLSNSKAKPVAAKANLSRRAKPDDNGFKKILLLVKNHCDTDFSFYKVATIQRRIARRLVLNHLETTDAYCDLLRENTQELNALHSDLLIGVTSFFRNPESFEYLQRKVLPKIIAQPGDAPVRIWVPGCSTGQEAYSLAMVFSELLDRSSRPRLLQIFATDLNEHSLQKARAGLYPKNLVEDISPTRLRRFFVEDSGGYRVSKLLRGSVVFARQNILSEPPFSRMDVVSCRNLLIYFETELQKRILPMFHYALNPEGVLFLGTSESVAGFANLFEPLGKTHKLYSKKPAVSAHRMPISGGKNPADKVLRLPPTTIASATAKSADFNAAREADRLTLSRYAPPGVVVNAGLQVLQFRGSTGDYLEPAIGNANFDVLKMAREGLMLPLRAAINCAKKEGKPVRKEQVLLKHGSGTRNITLQVVPLKNMHEQCFLILFEEEFDPSGRQLRKFSNPQSERSPQFISKKEESKRIQGLEAELTEVRDYLRSVQEQSETVQEELQASNEESTSANEELQSINEELETSKEELESTNEELTTVNDEMVSRNAELNRLNADLENLHVSINTAILVLGRDMTVRRFTPPAEKIFYLLPTDLGRPLGGIRHNLEFPPPPSSESSPKAPVKAPPLDLDALVRKVIDTISVRECEVRDQDGHWYLLRVRPYLTLDKKIDGAILVLVDIDALKRAEAASKIARDYAEAIVRTVRDPLIILRPDLRVNTANEAFYKTFQTTPAKTEGQLIYEVGDQEWDIPRLRQFLEEILPRNSFFNNFEVTCNSPHVGRRTMLLNARRLDWGLDAPPLILLTIADVTAWQRANAAVAALAAIVDSSEDAIISRDLNGIITSWNRGAERLFGYAASTVIGQSITLLVPNDRKDEESANLGRLQQGERIDTIRLRRDGSPVEVSVTSSPIKNAAGEIAGISKIVRDISIFKAAAERVRVSEIRFRRLFEAAQDGVLIIDPDSRRVTDANPSAVNLLDCPLNEILDRELWQFGLLGDEPSCQAMFRELQHRQIHRESLTIQTKAGRKREIQLVANCYFEEGRCVIQINIQDITAHSEGAAELARSRDEAVTASRAKDEFLAALSHELRTPLNPILLIASEASDNPALPEVVRADFDVIRKNIVLEARLIDDLLDITRISSGKLKVEMQPCDIHAVLRDAISVVRNDLDEKRIVFAENLTVANVTVVGDPVRLQQVFWNVLRNAVHFTPPAGKISVTTQADAMTSVLVITITDTGTGIPTDDLERIFETFAQGASDDMGTKRRFGGLGLGLAISRKLTELHAGTIKASSPGRGAGSSFIITLPLLTTPAAASHSEPATLIAATVAISPPVPVSARTPRRILIVEDHAQTRITLKSLLERRNLTVLTAGSVAEATVIANDHAIDIVVSDIGLPDGDGCALMRLLRAKQPDILGIALSGYGSETNIMESRDAGFTEHLTKPVSAAKLDEALKRITERHSGIA
ncbi:MAG TPA: CheR family methyltransferase [Opitutales bacterium]|jgi:two-component system CheB/CheR fusion protein|nr:CheR family methyltransferase [Opitutales bacterium]